MARLVSVSTAVPTHRVSPEATKAFIPRLVSRGAEDFARVVDSSRIRNRYAVAAVDELFQLRSIQARAERYVEQAVVLAERAVAKVIDQVGLAPQSIGALISVSNTGYMMPSLDAHLIERLGLNPACRRIPITELGCHAGVSAVGLGAELLHAPSTGSVLVVCLELCSLCLQVVDPTEADVFGSLLFGDGAAAALLTATSSLPGVEVLATRTVLFPESLDRAGLHLTNTGLRLVLSPALPRLIAERMPGAMKTFLETHRLRLDEIAFWVAHPGGPKILDAIGNSLGLPAAALSSSWAIWEEFGNLASATVLFILERLQRAACPANGDLGIMVAFGPGLTCELILLRWSEPQ